MDVKDLLDIRKEHKRNSPSATRVYALDLIMLTPELRKLAIDRISEHKVSLQKVCYKYNLNYKFLQLFINTKNPIGNYTFGTLQWDFLILLRVLGVKVRVQAVLTDPQLEDCLYDEYIEYLGKRKKRQDDINEEFFKHHEQKDS